MLGVLIGVVFGGVQLYLLMLAVGSIGAQKLKIWPLVVQFLCPFAGLGLCAWIARGQLVPCAVAMSAVLMIGAVVKFLLHRKRDQQGKKD